MTIKKINVSYSQTVQMRQFEPVVIFLSAEAEILPGEDPVTAAKAALAKVKRVVDDEVRLKKEQRRENYDDELEKSA